MGKGSVLKKFFGAISFLLLVAFLLTCLCALVVTIKAKKAKTGQVEIFDHILMNVDSDSMEECDQTDVSAYEIKSIPLRSMVVVEMVPKDSESANAWYADLKVGDVLTFQYVYYDKLIITHRITSIEPDPEFGGYIIQLEGDNKNSESGVMTQEIRTADRTSMNYVIGKVVRQNFLFGFFVSLFLPSARIDTKRNSHKRPFPAGKGFLRLPLLVSFLGRSREKYTQSETIQPK